MKYFLSSNIKYLRKIKKLNQSQLGLEFNRKHTSIGNWETGFSEPGVEELIKISSFFGVSLDDLLITDLTKEPEKKPRKADNTNWEEKYKQVKIMLADCVEEKELLKKRNQRTA